MSAREQALPASKSSRSGERRLVMNRVGISAKIWLSVGVFVLGYVCTMALQQAQGRAAEQELTATAGTLFPAAQSSEDVTWGFQHTVKSFGDALMVQDAALLQKAAEDGRGVVTKLNALASMSGLRRERTATARELASSIDSFLSEAQAVYRPAVENPAAITPEMQARIRDLAARTARLQGDLDRAKGPFSDDLRDQLRSMEKRSTMQRRIALVCFGVTLLIAWVVVNWTIRRAVTAPIQRVIDGVRSAAEQSTEACDRVAESGGVVARDAQEQAACVEETSASLEEISATTRENAKRARDADQLMAEARKRVEDATAAMGDLTTSMKMICESSGQVAAVLKSIDEISFHTNILALNAAVEAARAGEAGAGFSVVADEVRSLAKRAADAAKRSGEIIEKTIVDVNQGAELVSVAQEAFRQVSVSISDGGAVVSQISASSEEQSRGVAHIGTAVLRIESVTQNNAANAQKTANAASEMTLQVQRTREHVAELVAVLGLSQG